MYKWCVQHTSLEMFSNGHHNQCCRFKAASCVFRFVIDQFSGLWLAETTRGWVGTNDPHISSPINIHEPELPKPESMPLIDWRPNHWLGSIRALIWPHEKRSFKGLKGFEWGSHSDTYDQPVTSTSYWLKVRQEFNSEGFLREGDMHCTLDKSILISCLVSCQFSTHRVKWHSTWNELEGSRRLRWSFEGRISMRDNMPYHRAQQDPGNYYGYNALEMNDREQNFGSSQRLKFKYRGWGPNSIPMRQT